MEHTEHFIRKCLTDLLHPGEIQHYGLKAFKAHGQPLGLRARHQLLPFMLRQPHRHDGLGEGVFLRRGKLIEHLLQGAPAIVGQAHQHQRAGCIGGTLQQHIRLPASCMKCSVPERMSKASITLDEKKMPSPVW